MFSRRSFFRRAAAIVAAVALAPEIAFNVRLRVTEHALEGIGPYWLQTSLLHRYVSDAYAELRQKLIDEALYDRYILGMPRDKDFEKAFAFPNV